MTNADNAVRKDTGGAIPPEVRQRQLDEIKRRMEAGELDSDLALMETAMAMLDGDRPRPRL